MTVLRIKPVSKDYFKTSKVTIREIAIKRRAGVAIFAIRQNPDGSNTFVWLIPEPAKKLAEGKQYDAEHMETKRKYGQHLVQLVVQFKVKNGIIELADFAPATSGYTDVFDVEAVAFQLA